MVGQAEIRLIREPGNHLGYAADTDEAVFVPAGSYQADRFPELERLKRSFRHAQEISA